MSVRARLLVILALVAVVPLAASAWTTLAGHQRAFDEALSELYARTADLGAAVVDARARIVRQSIAPLAVTIYWGWLAPDERDGALWLIYQQIDDVSVVSLLDENGRSIGTSAWVAPETGGSAHPPLAMSGLRAFSRALAAAWSSPPALGTAITTDGAPLVPLTFSIDPSVRPPGVAAEIAHRGPWLLAVGWSLRQTCAELSAATPPDARVRLVEASGAVLCGAPTRGGPTGAAGRTSRYRAADGEVLAAAARVPSSPGWTVVVERPIAAALAPSRDLRNQAIVFIGIAGALSLFAGLVLARGILRPLGALAATARAVAARDFDRRAPGGRSDELGDLARAFNAMLDEIAAWNRELHRRVDGRTRELRAAQDALLESRKLAAVASLGAGVAHELNNPLTSVLALCQVVLGKARAAGEDPRRIELLAEMERECMRMRDIVVRMQRLTADYRGDGFAPVAVNDVIADVLAARADQLDGISLDHELPVALPHVLGHRGHLGDAVGQLVDNALAAMRGRPRRALRIAATSMEGELVKVAVTDTGGGLSAAFVGRAFDPFTTAKAEWQRTGLGLAIVQRIVDAHRGTIRIENTSPDGTEIVMYLPTARGAHLA